MARTISEIQQQITNNLLLSYPNLSTSKVAEWRLWTHVVAVAIYTFEVILDLFRNEMNALTSRITAGTVPWYAEMCHRFQNGYKPVFDKETAMYYYKEDVPEARIIKVVAIVEGEKRVSAKVAKLDADNKVVPLADSERENFIDYMKTIAPAGIQTSVVSTAADTIRYNLEVFYDPSTPASLVRKGVEVALEKFKTALSFNAMLYPQRLIDAVISVPGVATVKAVSIEHKASVDADFSPIDVMVEMDAGYFEYAAEGNVITTASIKNL